MTADTADIFRMLQRAKERFVSLLRGRGPCLLAVSGGSDSMGMMHLAAAMARAGSLESELHVACVDHGLRDGVDAEWALVEGQARALGLRAIRLTIAPETARTIATSPSVQQEARKERYRLLVEHAARLGAGAIATAHTMDDQAETVVLRLVRGTGVDGLAGIPEVRDDSGIMIVRPMLQETRAAIRAMLEAADVPWVNDPSNDDPRFARVRVRTEILPVMEAMGQGVAARLAALAGEAMHVSIFLNRAVEDDSMLVFLRLAGGIRVERAAFDRLPRALWSRLVRFAVKRAKGDLRGIERAHLEPVEEHLAAGDSTDALPMPGGVGIFASHGALYVFPGEIPSAPTGAGQPTATGPGAWRVRFAALGAIAELESKRPDLVGDLEVRARRPGDRMMGSTRRLKEVLSAAKIPRPYRDFVPVLARDDEIVSCPALVPSRSSEIRVRWLLEDRAPFLDIDFPITGGAH